MMTEYEYERRQSAERMEAVMLLASALGVIAAIMALFSQGWWPALVLFFLSVIAFALSRVFDFLAELLSAAGRREESKRPDRPEKSDHAA